MKNLIIFLIWMTTMMLSGTSMAYTSYDKQEIREMVIEEAIRQQVDPALALGIAKVESDFRADVVSHAGAIGVMQIMPATAESEFGVSRHRLYDPQTNIRIGVAFIKHLIAVYENRVDIALSHYNGGSRVKDKYGNLSIIPATRSYVQKVSGYRAQFAREDARLSLPAINDGYDDRYDGGYDYGSTSKLASLREVRERLSYKQQMQLDDFTQAPDLQNNQGTTLLNKVDTTNRGRIASLQALHLHNLSRHLKSDSHLQANSGYNATPHSVQSTGDTQLSKRAKVQQWESIFQQSR